MLTDTFRSQWSDQTSLLTSRAPNKASLAKPVGSFLLLNEAIVTQCPHSSCETKPRPRFHLPCPRIGPTGVSARLWSDPTSYWMYCFLHSGVIWAERCSVNFILTAGWFSALLLYCRRDQDQDQNQNDSAEKQTSAVLLQTSHTETLIRRIQPGSLRMPFLFHLTLANCGHTSWSISLNH